MLVSSWNFAMPVAAAGRRRAEAATESGLRTVKVDKILKERTGGTQTICAMAVVEGKPRFLRSNLGSERNQTRYANVESELLTSGLSQLFGLRCPQAEMVRLEPACKLRRDMGDTVMAVDLVNRDWARAEVRPGHFPDLSEINVDQWLKMFVMDLLIGNADRRGANFFLVPDAQGKLEPVPVDNNSGFSTMVHFKVPSNHQNFIQTFHGVGDQEVLKDLGTVRAVVDGAAWEYGGLIGEKSLHPRLLEIAERMMGRLDNRTIDKLVDSLPPEVLPGDIEVKPESWGLPPEQASLLNNGLSRTVRGKEALKFRQHELKEVLRWRRDHLVAALKEYLPTVQ